MRLCYRKEAFATELFHEVFCHSEVWTKSKSLVDVIHGELFHSPTKCGLLFSFKAFGAISKQIDFLRENADLAVLSAKDFFEYFVRGLYEEDKWRCCVDVRENLLREVPEGSDAFDLVTPFVKLMEEEIKPPCLSTCPVSVLTTFKAPKPVKVSA